MITSLLDHPEEFVPLPYRPLMVHRTCTRRQFVFRETLCHRLLKASAPIPARPACEG